MKTICNISRFIGEIFVFVGKFGLFVYFVLRMLLISCSFVSAGARESQGDRFTKPETIKKKVCQNSHLLFYAQSPDFHKLGLCYNLKILYL